MKRNTTQLLTSVALTLLLSGATAAAASTATLLLPSFEVDLTGQGVTTFFSLVNPSAEPVEVEMTVRSNWGIEVLSTGIELAAYEARTMNLGDWLVRGGLPDRGLSADEAEHARAALTGRPSPRSGFYYGSGGTNEIANGSLVVTATGTDTLFGDFQVLDLAAGQVRGDLLLHTSAALGSSDGIGVRHGLRFLNGGALGVVTEVTVYTPSSKRPSENAELAEQEKIRGRLTAYRQNGELLDEREMSFQPLETLKVSDLGLDAVAGWIEIETAQETFVTVQYAGEGRFSFGLRAVVLPSYPEDERLPGLRIRASANGVSDDRAPGPRIPVGQEIVWLYTVVNDGGLDLYDVTVTDSEGTEVSCPRRELGAGETMTCTAARRALAGQQESYGLATAWTADGEVVRDHNPSHYFGQEVELLTPALDVESLIDGKVADEDPVVVLMSGEPLVWTYVVANTGETRLAGISITSEDPAVAVGCPKKVLEAGESMACSGESVVNDGWYSNVVTVTSLADPGDGNAVAVGASDSGHYHGLHIDLP